MRQIVGVALNDPDALEAAFQDSAEARVVFDEHKPPPVKAALDQGPSDRTGAGAEFDDEARATLLDIVATEISPELLPAGSDGCVAQSTEGTIGPYELHDFFLYHFLRFGMPPEKLLFLAAHATFHRAYGPEEIRRWLQVFVRRFFASQFKRSCLPDGPKVGSVSLSPRGDWRMPSDAVATMWLRWAET